MIIGPIRLEITNLQVANRKPVTPEDPIHNLYLGGNGGGRLLEARALRRADGSVRESKGDFSLKNFKNNNLDTMETTPEAWKEGWGAVQGNWQNIIEASKIDFRTESARRSIGWRKWRTGRPKRRSCTSVSSLDNPRNLNIWVSDVCYCVAGSEVRPPPRGASWISCEG